MLLKYHKMEKVCQSIHIVQFGLCFMNAYLSMHLDIKERVRSEVHHNEMAVISGMQSQVVCAWFCVCLCIF